MTEYGWRTAKFLGGKHIGPRFPTPESAGAWFRDNGWADCEPALKLYVIDEGGQRPPHYATELAACHSTAYGFGRHT